MRKRILKTAAGFILVVGMLTSVLAGCSGNNTPAESGTGKETSFDTPSETAKDTAAETKPPENTDKETGPQETDEPETNAPAATSVTIGTADELMEFADQVNSETKDYGGYTIKLTADIDLAGKDWTPLNPVFMNDAVFDGDGHTISNMTIYNDEGSPAQGFIGLVDPDTWITVKNVAFKDAVLTVNERHNGIVIGEINGGFASVENVSVLNCKINGATGNDVHDMQEGGELGQLSFREGGIAGMVQNGGSIDVIGCTVDGLEITGFHNLAGLIGYLEPGQTTIKNNTVKNVVLNFTAGYAYGNYVHDDDPDTVAENGKLGRGRRYTNVFYNLAGWTDHEEDDQIEENTFENVIIHDVVSNVDYNGYENPCYGAIE